MSRAEGPFMMLSRRWKTDDGFLGLSLNARGAWLTLALHTEDTGSLVVSRVALGHVLGLRPSHKHQELGYFKELAAAGMVALSDGGVELIARHQTGQASRVHGQRSAAPVAMDGQSNGNAVALDGQRSGNAMAMQWQCVATAPSELPRKSAPKNRIEQNRTEDIESAVGAPVSPSAPPPALEQVALVAGHLSLTAPPKPEAKRASAKPNTRVPATGVAPEQLAAWCERWAIDAKDPEFVRFLDHFRGTGVTHADWGATWRNWQRRASEFAARGGGNGFASARSRQVQQGDFLNPAWKRAEEIT